MSISVCMIAKNDGDTILKSLESVKSIAHEVVVVDTGSRDDTLKIVSDFEKKHNILQYLLFSCLERCYLLYLETFFRQEFHLLLIFQTLFL